MDMAEPGRITPGKFSITVSPQVLKTVFDPPLRHSKCPPAVTRGSLRPQPTSPSPSPFSSNDRSKSVEPKLKNPRDHLDYNFLRMSSAVVHGGEEVQYRCSGCLRVQPSLSALQNHVAMSWMDGYSCRVFYRKLREMQHNSDMRKLHQRLLAANVAKNGQQKTVAVLPGRKLPEAAPEESKDATETTQVLNLETVEKVRRNLTIQKWLNEIELPDVISPPSPETF